MCQPYGWYCKIDNDNLENLIEKCAFTLRMDENRVKECYQALVDNMAFFVIDDENGSYLADTQQLYNFEILNNSRVRERERKAKSRAKAATEKTNKEQDISSGSVTASVKESAPSEPIGDLPSNEADPFDW